MSPTAPPPRAQPHALQLERYLLGELDPAATAAVEAALAQDPLLADQVAAMRSEDAAVRARYPAGLVVPGLRAQLAAPRRPLHQRPAAFAGLAVAAVAACALLPGSLPSAPGGRAPAVVAAAPVIEDTVAKGDLDAKLLVYRQVGAAIEPLADGALAQAGDVLGLAYQAAGALHGVILSVDGRGAVTLHQPAHPEAGTALDRTGTINLSQGYQLDDAPAFERFVFVTGGAPIDVGAVLDAARALPPAAARAAPLELPPGLDQRSLLLRKAGTDALLQAPAPTP
jgi:anti-sigma factor RsiW